MRKQYDIFGLPRSELAGKDAQSWYDEEWKTKGVEILGLLSDITSYIAAFKSTEGEGQSELLRPLSEALDALVNMALPNDAISAGNYAGALVKLADNFYRFWIDQQTYMPYSENDTMSGGIRSTEMIDRAIQPNKS